MIRRCHSGPTVVAGVKCGGLHAKWPEQVLFEELIKSRSRRDLHDTAEGVETSQRAVAPAGARLEIQRCGGFGDQAGECTATQTIKYLSHPGGARRTTAQTRDVRQQILNGDLS